MSKKVKGITKDKPRLQNLDELFSIYDQSPENGGLVVTNIEISKLTPYHGHVFQMYEGERLDDMVASIESNGVLVPIIIRESLNSNPTSTDLLDSYEILAGHNRVNAAKLAGLNEVPAIILGNISDEEAQAYVVETNLMQRSFSDMLHSEKAAAIALHHSKMFSQGKRNDILEQLRKLEDAHNGKEQVKLDVHKQDNETEGLALPQVGKKSY